MQRLTAKKTLITAFSLIIAFSVTAVFIGFFFYFKETLTNLVKKDLSEEVNEIVDAFVVSENKKIVFKLSPDGLSLREELIKDGISGIFFDKNLDLIKGFGAFEVYTSSDTASLKNLLSLSNSSLTQNQVSENTISWQGQNYIVYIVPLRSGDSSLGVAVLGKPVTILQTVWKSLLSSVLTFGLVAMLGGFSLVYLVVKKAFNPIEKINKKIDEIDFNNLNKSIEIEGPKDDEFVQLSEKINQMLERIKFSSERQREFISNASHELKTPLALAISSLDVMNSQKKSEELLEVRDDLLNLGKLVDQLLVLSGLHGGKVDKNSKSVVKEAVDNAVQLHKSQIEEKNLNILVQVEPDALVKIPAEYLNLIVNNLISNSVKYSKSNGKIVIKVEQKGNKAELTVQDFGDGISEADLPHIFERFFTTAKEGKNLKRKGHGIGLAIVKNICDEFGVSYRAESEKGKGTSIILGFC